MTDNRAMGDAVQQTVRPIWRPNTTYCLDFVLTDLVDDKKTTEFKYYYGFKTLGPVGHYPVPDPVTPVGQQPPVKNQLTELSKSPLTSLRQYLDYNRSYPNADGSLLQSKPTFYGNEQCKVSLFFSNPYVYHMLKDWAKYGDTRPKIKGALNLIIKDPLTDLLIQYPFNPEITGYPKADEQTMEWVTDNDPRIPLGIQLINNFINANPEMKCSLTLGQPLKPKSYGYTVTLTDLKPSKLYTVLVNNYFDVNQNDTEQDGENVLVHQFGFQTSRYRDFAEQVQSFIIDETESRKALFNVELNLVQDQIDALYHLVSASVSANTLSDSIALKYQHPFDRAIEGVLKLSPLDPAQNTEVNRIIDTNTGDIKAILIRNPEPFNIPKMPLEEIKDSVKVLYGEEDVLADPEKVLHSFNNEYKVLHSKDYSQVLIMHDSKQISGTKKLNVQFEYRMWNNEGTQVGGKTPLTLSVDKQLLEI